LINVRDDSFRTYVLDQLDRLPSLRSIVMFGGIGIYHAQMFFGILHKGRLYFKTDAAGRAAYVERGMGPFRPKRGMTLTSYYEVPPDVIDDSDTLCEWARRAIASARVARTPKAQARAPRKKSKPKTKRARPHR
jgi:DNA transformation protein